MANENKFENQERDRFNALDYKGITPLDQEIESDFETETAAEISAPVNVRRDYAEVDRDDDEVVSGGKGTGFLALVLSILSLFILPVILGAAGIIIGFIARRRGANALGAWAIGIGLISLILGILIKPFF